VKKGKKRGQRKRCWCKFPTQATKKKGKGERVLGKKVPPPIKCDAKQSGGAKNRKGKKTTFKKNFEKKKGGEKRGEKKQESGGGPWGRTGAKK